MDSLDYAMHNNYEFNGIIGDPFRPERGIRHGDSNSLYIFIICADYLGGYKNFISNSPKIGIWYESC